MGTHGAIAVTKMNGEHFCTEMTMDGSQVMDISIDLMEKISGINQSSEDIVHNELRHSGDFDQENTDREHGQVYYTHFNFREQYIGTCYYEYYKNDGATLDDIDEDEERWLIPEFDKQIVRLERLGWKFKNEHDCPKGSKCYEPAICYIIKL